MTEGPADASSKLRLVLDYLPCEACLSKPVQDQELLCSICRRLDRDVDVTTVRRVTVLLERPAPVVAIAPPMPLPPPEETPVPAPVEAPVPVEPAVPAPVEEPRPVVGVDVLTEELVETPPPAVAPPPPVEETPPPVEQAPAQAEVAPEPQPEPAPEPTPEPERKRRFSLFRRKEEKPAEAAPAEEEPVFDDVASFEPRDDDFGVARGEAAAEPEEDPFDFTRTPPPREERPAEAVVPVADELEDDFLYRPAEEPPREPEPEPLLLAEEPVEAPREEVPVEPAQGQNPWAPPEEFLLDEPAPAEPAREARAWPDESEPNPFLRPTEEAEEEIVEMEVLPDDEPPAPEPQRWAPSPAPEEDVVETEIVEMEVVEDEAPAPQPEPVPAEPAREEAPPKRGGFSSLFKRKKAAEEARASEAAPEPAPEPAYVPPGEAEPAPGASPWSSAEEVQADELDLAAPAPAPVAGPLPETDLHRLPGFEGAHQEALARERIESISHLSGHDPVELAERTGLPQETLASWVHVADLVQEVGVPMDAALALVAAGVQGPRGLRDMDGRAIVDRVGEQGDAAGVTFQNVKRWKRRA